jgi:hypothetical protein
MSGLAILATCQEIASEAGAILHPKLRAMNEGPAQIITNSVALGEDGLGIMIERFLFASSGKNTKRLLDLDEDIQVENDLYPAETTSRPIHIAIRNFFADRKTANKQRCIDRMRILGEEIFPWFRSELSYWLPTFAGLYTQVCGGPRMEILLHFLMPTLTANKKEACNKVLPLTLISVLEHEGTPTFTIDSGGVLDAGEWEDKWAESESY